jgi:hypothetical protein
MALFFSASLLVSRTAALITFWVWLRTRCATSAHSLALSGGRTLLVSIARPREYNASSAIALTLANV